jgi:alkylation response protein AidB-like acyl-CoA dehydrogenase
MNFDLTEEQRLLSDSVANFVKKESPLTRFRALRTDPVGWSPKIWRQLGEMGLIGAIFPEDAGGMGGTFVDAMLIAEHLGGGLVPEPFTPTLVAGWALHRAGATAEQVKRILTPALDGRASLALATSETGSRYDVRRVETRATQQGAGWRLDGEKRWVQNGHAADTVLVSARTEAGVGLFALARGAAGMTTRAVRTIDGRHAGLLTFTSAEAELVSADAGAALDEAQDVGAMLSCAEGHGVMRAALWMTVEYLRTREQFGVKIGTFQALQHRAVDMFVETELARSTAILAAIRITEPDVALRHENISAAKVQLAMAGRLVTQQAIQLHGGIGITDEADIGLYFKRMHALATVYGDEEFHLARFAATPQFIPA